MSCVIRVSQPKAPADVRLDIHAEGCEPGKAYLLRLRGKDQAGLDFESSATFVANGKGMIDLNTQAPKKGTYSGVDPMGLFWSMNSVKKGISSFVSKDITPLEFILTVEISGRVVASMVIERWFWSADSGIIRQPIDKPGLVGTLYYPTSGVPHATIVFLGGSDGGLHEGASALLATHGYAVLALAYFGIGPLPKQLVEIPVEYIAEAVSWLETQKIIRLDRFGMVGWSKGGEFALVAAATYPEKFRAVAAISPSSVVWQGLVEGRAIPAKACWSKEGKSLPYVPLKLKGWTILKILTRQPFSFLSSYSDSLNDNEARQAARIPIENFKGPLFLMSGSKDALWPSPDMCQQIISTLDQHKHPSSYEHVSCLGAGHGLRPPFLPSCGETMRDKMLFGGSRVANAAACVKFWEKLLTFFDSSLS